MPPPQHVTGHACVHVAPRHCQRWTRWQPAKVSCRRHCSGCGRIQNLSPSTSLLSSFISMHKSTQRSASSPRLRLRRPARASSAQGSGRDCSLPVRSAGHGTLEHQHARRHAHTHAPRRPQSGTGMAGDQAGPDLPCSPHDADAAFYKVRRRASLLPPVWHCLRQGRCQSVVGRAPLHTCV